MEPNYNEIALTNYFNYLPDETIIKIALDLPINHITHLCITNRRFGEIICNDNYFWKNKFKRDYGDVNFEPDSWKLLYMIAGNVIKFSGIIATSTLRNIRASEVATTGETSYSVIIDYNNDVWVWGDNVENLHKLNIKAKKVSCSDNATMFIDLDDNVWITPNWNILTFSSRTKLERILGDPIPIPNIKAKDISLGIKHMGIIDLDNNIWMLGNNDYGQLGLGDTLPRNNIINIPGFKAIKIVCDTQSTAFIDIDNNIWTFGRNYYGQLGLGDYNDRHIPTQINELKGKEISMSTHTMVIDLEGKMWGFGKNQEGQLSINKNNMRGTNIPTEIILDEYIIWKSVSVSPNRTTAIDHNYDLWMCGSLYDPNNIPSGNKIYNKLRKIIGVKIFKLSTKNQASIFIGTNVQYAVDQNYVITQSPINI